MQLQWDSKKQKDTLAIPSHINIILPQKQDEITYSYRGKCTKIVGKRPVI